MNLARAGAVPDVHFAERGGARIEHGFQRAAAFEHSQRGAADGGDAQLRLIRQGRQRLAFDHRHLQTAVAQQTGQRQAGNTATVDDDVEGIFHRGRHQRLPAVASRPLRPMLCRAS